MNSQYVGYMLHVCCTCVDCVDSVSHFAASRVENRVSVQRMCFTSQSLANLFLSHLYLRLVLQTTMPVGSYKYSTVTHPIYSIHSIYLLHPSILCVHVYYLYVCTSIHLYDMYCMYHIHVYCMYCNILRMSFIMYKELQRSALHVMFGLPMDRPFFRTSNLHHDTDTGECVLCVHMHTHVHAHTRTRTHTHTHTHTHVHIVILFSLYSGPYLLNPHEGLPQLTIPGETALVSGWYTYHHYMQDKFDDNVSIYVLILHANMFSRRF